MFRAINFRKHLLGVAIVLAFLIYISNAGSPGINPVQRGASPQPNVKEVSSTEAKALIDGGAMVIDVREAEAYRHRHLPHAKLIPLDALQAQIPLLRVDSKLQSIVVYCGDGVSHGPEGTAILNAAGFANAVNLKGGVEGWDSAKLPMEREENGVDPVR